MPPLVTIRPMAANDLPTVERWLQEPHVAPWFTRDTTLNVQVQRCRRYIENPASKTTMCTVLLEAQRIGFCQWYGWEDYPAAGACHGARLGEIGADYAIGEVDAIGRGLGTAMIGSLVVEVRRYRPGAGLLISPEAANRASRRVLERNGFELVDVRSVLSEPHERPMAIYRLGPDVPAMASCTYEM